MDLGLALHTVIIIVSIAFFGTAGILVAIRQEQARQRAQQRVSAEVGRMELPEIRRLLQQGLMTPNQEFWQVLEEGLLTRFRPRDRQEELQRQRLLQDVRLRLMP